MISVDLIKYILLQLHFNHKRKLKFVGNKAKGRRCAYKRVRNVCFSENLACFVSSEHPF